MRPPCRRCGALRAAVGGSAATVTGGAKVIVNSDDPEAAITNGGTITATELDVTGGINSTGGGGGFFGGINLGTPPQPDPLRGIPQPDPAALADQSHGNTHFSSGNHTLNPVPTIIWGRNREQIASRIHSLVDITPAIVEALTAD